MLRATAYLIVFTLAALPATSTICLAWCPSQSATSECHEEGRAPAAASAGMCAKLTTGAFIRQEVRPVPDAHLAVMASPWSTLIDIASAGPAMRQDWRPLGSPPRAPLVLRL